MFIRCLLKTTYKPNIQNGISRCDKTLNEYITRNGESIKEVISDYGKGIITKSEVYPNKIVNTLSNGDSIVYTNYRKVMEGSQLVLKGYYARHDFSYTQEGMVSQVAYASEDGNRLMEYSYTPGTTKLEAIHNVTYPDNDIGVRDYYADGEVKSYIAGTTLLVDNIYYVDDINGERQVFAEYWGGVFDPLENERQHCTEITSIQIPTYFPALPPFIGDPNMDYWEDLFFYKYVFARAVNTQTDEEVAQLTCETDERGQIKRLRRSSKDWIGRETYTEYIFTYEEE